VPTAAEAANAAKYRIQSIQSLNPGNFAGSIQTAIANGQPVAMTKDIFDQFESNSGTFVDVPPAGAQVDGSHSVTAYKFDANGLWVANQWGTGWKAGGTVELSWNYVRQYTAAAYTIVPITPAGM
jgi:hypothetical protein